MRFAYVEYMDRDGIRYGSFSFWCAACTSIAEFIKKWEDKYSILTIKYVLYEGVEYYV